MDKYGHFENRSVSRKALPEQKSAEMSNKKLNFDPRRKKDPYATSGIFLITTFHTPKRQF